MTRTPLLVLCVGLFACTEYKIAGHTAPEDGAGGAPNIVVDPPMIDFGVRTWAEVPSEDVLVTVSNDGSATLSLAEVDMSLATAPFRMSMLDTMEIPPGGSSAMVVSYDPTETGGHEAQIHFSSNDPVQPVVSAPLVGALVDPTDTGSPEPVERYPDIELSPLFHDFGTLDTGTTAEQAFTIANTGEDTLQVSTVDLTGSTEMTLDLDPGTNGALPWSLAPGQVVTVWVDYAPADTAADENFLDVGSNDPDEPVVTATIIGNARPFEGFSTGWYIWDDGLDHETTSSSSHPVDHHGDTDLYWYEPSGAHGLVDSSDPVGDFAVMRDYVIANAGSPSVVSGPLTFDSGSDLATFEWAVFTYVLCDFWIDAGDDPARYEVSAASVDDGIQVMVNGSTLGHMSLGESHTSWSLASVGVPGAVNTLIVILVDDSAVARYLRELAFYKDGAMVH